VRAGEGLGARRNLAGVDRLRDANGRSLSLVQQRVREGANPTIDESLQLVEVNRLEASRALVSSRVEVATLQLKALAGLSPDAPPALLGDLPTAAAPGSDRGAGVPGRVSTRPDAE